MMLTPGESSQHLALDLVEGGKLSAGTKVKELFESYCLVVPREEAF